MRSLKIALLLTLIAIPGTGQTVTCSADVDRSLCKQISDMGPLFALSVNRNEPLRIQLLDPKAYEQAVKEVEKNCVLNISKRPGCNLFAGIYADSVHFNTPETEKCPEEVLISSDAYAEVELAKDKQGKPLVNEETKTLIMKHKDTFSIQLILSSIAYIQGVRDGCRSAHLLFLTNQVWKSK